MKDAMLIELAEMWELQAATGGDGLNRLHPAACQELRACADTLRMLVSAPAAPAAQSSVSRKLIDLLTALECSAEAASMFHSSVMVVPLDLVQALTNEAKKGT